MKKSFFILALVAGIAAVFAVAMPDLALAASVAASGHVDHSLLRYVAEGAAAVAVSKADLDAITTKLTEITGKFNAKSDELSTKAEAAMAEVKNKGELLTATKAEVDKLLVEQTTLKGDVNKAQARLTAAEQEIVRKTGPANADARKSIGQRMIEDDKVKAFAAAGSGGIRGKHRFSVQAAITSVDYPVSEPSIVQPQVVPGTLPMLKQRLFVRDLIPVGQTGSPAVFWVRQTGFTNAARVVSESTAKPASTIAYDGVMTQVTTIAHTFKMSKQIMDDFKQLRTDIDREMRYGLKYAEEQELLLGDGTGIHIDGIVPQATAFAAEFTPALGNRIDDIRLAMLQSQLARLPATGIVMHFIDWARIELTKDQNGQYIFANPLRLAGNNLWGLPVVPTEIASFETNFLVGAFQGGAQIYDREEMNVEIATENEDDFIKNMITGRCEERIALAVFRPEAFIYGAFAAGSGT